MRRLISLSVITLLVAVFVGCEEEKPPELPSPKGLILTAAEGGIGLELRWKPVAEADGYYVYFRGAGRDSADAISKVLAQEADTIVSFFHTSKVLSEVGLGEYYVVAVKGEYVGEASDTVSAIPVSASGIILYERDYANGDSSAYGWDEKGEGRIFSIGNTTEDWDLYLDDGKPGEIDSSNLRLVSPQVSVGASRPPEGAVGDTTYFAESEDPTAPAGMVVPFVPRFTTLKPGRYYAKVDGAYYVRITVKEIFQNGIKFDQSFQPVAGFRRF